MSLSSNAPVRRSERRTWVQSSNGRLDVTAGGPGPQTDLKPNDVAPDLSKAMTKESLAAAKAGIEMVFGLLPGLGNPAKRNRLSARHSVILRNAPFSRWP